MAISRIQGRHNQLGMSKAEPDSLWTTSYRKLRKKLWQILYSPQRRNRSCQEPQNFPFHANPLDLLFPPYYSPACMTHFILPPAIYHPILKVRFQLLTVMPFSGFFIPLVTGSFHLSGTDCKQPCFNHPILPKKELYFLLIALKGQEISHSDLQAYIFKHFLSIFLSS